jgi:hypothetical protein
MSFIQAVLAAFIAVVAWAFLGSILNPIAAKFGAFLKAGWAGIKNVPPAVK